jgi:hypothetical protein
MQIYLGWLVCHAEDIFLLEEGKLFSRKHKTALFSFILFFTG